MLLESVKTADLIPAPYNPRVINQNMMSKLKKGIKEFGLVQPLVANKRNNMVIGGHQRLLAAQELGITEVPVYWVDLDEKKAKSLCLSLNKLSGDWDYDKLGDLLVEFETEPNFDIELTGFDAIEAVEMASLGDITTGSVTFDDATPGDRERDGSPGSANSGNGYSIVYTLVFDDEGQQKEWHDYLRRLKAAYPGMDTISSRIIKDVRERAV